MPARPQLLADTARSLGVWAAANRSILAIHLFVQTGQLPDNEQRSSFDRIATFFDFASRGADRTDEVHRLSIGPESGREYSAFIAFLNACEIASETERLDEPDSRSILNSLRETAKAFSIGGRPEAEASRRLAEILRAIAQFHSRQAVASFRTARERAPLLPGRARG
jgi:hypothetical protein